MVTTTTYGDLQNIIATNLNRTDITAQIALGINNSIIHYKENHVWFNEEQAAITLNVNDPLVPNIPSDFLYEIDGNGLVINYSNLKWPLVKKHPVEYDLADRQGTGLPVIYTNRINQLYVYYYPDQAYDMTLYYIKDYNPLVNLSDSNDWTNYGAQLITAKTMADMYRFCLKDIDRANDLLMDCERYLDQIQRRAKRRVGTGRLMTENITKTSWYNNSLVGERSVI